jgi:hypothetical protein
MIDAVSETQHRLNLSSIFRRKVRPHSAPQIRGFTDVENLAVDVAKQVHPRRAGECVREMQLVGLRMAIDCGELQQIVYPQHAEARRSLQ